MTTEIYVPIDIVFDNIEEVDYEKTILNWLLDNVQDEDWNWTTDADRIRFVHDEDAIMFRLRFGL